jgi:prefoldin subunit 5
MSKVASILRPYCQKVLPLTYDDSLSYYECILKLTDKCNEIIEQFDDWSETIAQLQEAITDIGQMKTDISNLRTDLTQFETITNSRFENLTEVLNSMDAYVKQLAKRVDSTEDSISTLTQLIARIRTALEKQIADTRKELIDYVDNKYINFEQELELLKYKLNQVKVNLQSQIDELRRRVDELDTTVTNPWRTNLGKIPIAKNINFMYNDLADAVPTAEEYVKLGLTAQAYSEFGLRAWDYVRRGKEKLHYFWVCSPAYGWWQEINNVFTSVINYCADTYSAGAYASLGLTADEYSALDITALQYYSFKLHKQGVFVEDGTLSSIQYALLEREGVGYIEGANATFEDGVISFEQI